MQFSLLTIVTFMNVFLSASAESPYMRGGSANIDKDANSRSLALSDLSVCIDSDEGKKVGSKTCEWITEDEENMAKKCRSSSSDGKIFDLCPFTCAKVNLGPCTASKLVAMIKEKDSIIATNAATINALADVGCILTTNEDPNLVPTWGNTLFVLNTFTQPHVLTSNGFDDYVGTITTNGETPQAIHGFIAAYDPDADYYKDPCDWCTGCLQHWPAGSCAYDDWHPVSCEDAGGVWCGAGGV